MAWLSDEEYIYRQDIKDKKSAGRGAFHKKGGSKSKKCTLPSDYMTRKEKMAMNGEVMTYNPNAWYTWEEFKKLPMEYQIKYVNSLLLRYDCGLRAIGEILFGITGPNLYNYFKRKGQQQYLNSTGTKGGHSHDAGRKRFEADVLEARSLKSTEEIQNDSKSGSFEIILASGGSKCSEEEPIDEKEFTIQEKIKKAQDTVELYASNGVLMTPEQINKIFEDKVGMSFAAAIEECQAEESAPENDDRPVDNSTDVQSFSIVMDRIDMDIIKYISDLFDGKKLSVSIDVKEVL